MTSLKTVFAGFVVASLIAIPLGVFCGMGPIIRAALSPIIQIFCLSPRWLGCRS